MDFAYTPAQQELKARAAAYAELLMGYEDEAERAGGPLPKETVDKLTRAAMDAGVYGINMPAEWGGAGLTLLEQVIVEEEFGKVTNCLWDIPWRPANVLALASPEQRERYLLPILRGERFDAFATTEPDAGSDAGAIATTATPVDGGWLINGEKWFVTCGDVADFLLVQANVLPGNENTLFFVEKDTPGVRISRTPHFMHSAVNGHPEFVFENVFVPTDAVLGEVGQGFELTKDWFTDERLMIAARTVGVAERALRLARDWAIQRKQFGVPISDFQMIQAMLAVLEHRNLHAGRDFEDVGRGGARIHRCLEDAVGLHHVRREVGEPHLLRAHGDGHLVADSAAVEGTGVQRHAAGQRDSGAGVRARHEVGGADELRDEARGGSFVDVLGRAALVHPALAHDRDPVGHRQRLLLVVRDEHEGDAHLALNPLELHLHRLAQFEVERGERLVEQQHRGAVDQRPRQRNPLPLATGQRARLVLVTTGELDQFEHFADAPGHFGLADPAAAQSERDVLPDGEVVEEGVALEDGVDVAAVRRHIGDVLAVQRHLTVGRVDEAADHPQRRGLAAAGRTQQGEELTRRDVEVQVAYGGTVAVGLGDAAQRHRTLGRGHHRVDCCDGVRVERFSGHGGSSSEQIETVSAPAEQARDE